MHEAAMGAQVKVSRWRDARERRAALLPVACWAAVLTFTACPGTQADGPPSAATNSEDDRRVERMQLVDELRREGIKADDVLEYDLDSVAVDAKGQALFLERYLAAPVDTVRKLMVDAGFADVRRLDGLYYQPLLVGSASPGNS